MSKVTDRILKIKEQHIGTTGVRVLLVEGKDDVLAFRVFLDSKFQNWEKSWRLEPAGNKKQVLDFLQIESTWLGVVDCDEWTPSELAAHIAALPNLKVLPRFCMESYLIDPVELWSAFPQMQKDKIPGGLANLQHEIEISINDWIRQAALWHEIRPLWRKLRELGFPDIANSNPPVPSNAALQVHLPQWQAVLNPTNIIANVDLLEQSLLNMPKDQLYASWLYAKKFYPLVVNPTLNKLLGTKNESDRRKSILRTRSVPSDLDPLWKAMDLI